MAEGGGIKKGGEYRPKREAVYDKKGAMDAMIWEEGKERREE